MKPRWTHRIAVRVCAIAAPFVLAVICTACSEPSAAEPVVCVGSDVQVLTADISNTTAETEVKGRLGQDAAADVEATGLAVTCTVEQYDVKEIGGSPGDDVVLSGGSVWTFKTDYPPLVRSLHQQNVATKGFHYVKLPDGRDVYSMLAAPDGGVFAGGLDRLKPGNPDDGTARWWVARYDAVGKALWTQFGPTVSQHSQYVYQLARRPPDKISLFVIDNTNLSADSSLVTMDNNGIIIEYFDVFAKMPPDTFAMRMAYSPEGVLYALADKTTPNPNGNAAEIQIWQADLPIVQIPLDLDPTEMGYLECPIISAKRMFFTSNGDVVVAGYAICRDLKLPMDYWPRLIAQNCKISLFRLKFQIIIRF